MAGPFGTLIFFVPVIILFYFMLIRPQQKALKAHQALVAGLKRGDTVVLSTGVIGKITRVEAAPALVCILYPLDRADVPTPLAPPRSCTSYNINA